MIFGSLFVVSLDTDVCMNTHSLRMNIHSYGTGHSGIQKNDILYLESFCGLEIYDHRQFNTGEQCD